MLYELDKATGAVLGAGAVMAFIAAAIGTIVLGIANGLICGGIAWVAFLATVIIRASQVQQLSYREDGSNIHMLH